MKAVYISEFGAVENLRFLDVDDPPSPVANEVLVKVRAAGLNRADLLQRKGLYPAPAGFPERIPGLEFAGDVVATGGEVTRFASGDKVFGITAGGAHAEYLLTFESTLAKMPENLDFSDAAAIPEAFITAHDAIFTQGKLAEGESLLIHAVGSGVGLAALQLAKARGIFTIGTSRTAEKLRECEPFGLDAGIETGGDTKFSEKILKSTLNSGVDVILDLVGASYFEENLKVLASKGRLILVGLVGGRRSEIDLGLALSKRLQIIGTVLRSRSTEEKAHATKAFEEDVIPLIESGKVSANIDLVFPAREAAKAHKYLESNASFGKVVLNFSD